MEEQVPHRAFGPVRNDIRLEEGWVMWRCVAMNEALPRRKKRDNGGATLISTMDRRKSPLLAKAARSGAPTASFLAELFGTEEENGDADMVANAVGRRAKEEIGKKSVAVRAHGDEITFFIFDPLDNLGGRFTEG